MKKLITIIITPLLCVLLIQSCKKDSAGQLARTPNLPEEVFKYDQVAQGANGFVPTGSITINNEMATLGRVLFYETQLSVNNRVSCGSCHSQQKAFADNAAFSKGFENGQTKRNTPAIINSGTQSSYFWDMRESSLATMVTKPIENHIEMGLDQPEYVVAKVSKLPYYKPLFIAAFNSEEVSMDRIGLALSNFVGAMVSVTSKYDIGALNNFSNFTEDELEGKQLFTSTLPCSGCHGGENFSGWGSFSQNIGLDMDYADDGQPGIDWMTGREQDGWFKVPSLRNIALTGPYMHDGRFNTLEEVIAFYDEGIQAHEQLSPSLREGWNGSFVLFGDAETGNIPGSELLPLRMHLSQAQKASLKAFLMTLSDDQLISDVKFSDPFTQN